MRFHIGIDDTDSREGMCTTYLGGVLVENLRNNGYNLFSYPRLIRLNPNIPYKTRGNGAVEIRLEIDENDVDEVKDIALRIVEEYSQKDSNAGLAFVEGDVPNELVDLSERALHEEVDISDALDLADVLGLDYYGWGNGRGVIGALSCIGYELDDYTFELLTYRYEDKFGSERFVDSDSVFDLNENFYPEIFDSVDEDEDDIIIAPHGPDPVLYGIRGESPEILEKGRDLIVSEDYEFYLIYKSNQGTDDHLEELSIDEIDKFNSVIVEGEVVSEPNDIEGGHVFFDLSDGDSVITCAAYEPTKDFRKVVRRLRSGDEVRVFGGVSERMTLNLEKFELLDKKEFYEELNPVCPDCGNNMKSAGRDQGYRCRKCGTSASEDDVRRRKIDRDIEEGFYEVPPMARRHLSKPLIRDG